jgi:hypothetical protein
MPQSFRMQFGYWDEASQTITLQMTTYQLVEQPGAHPGFRAALLFEGSQFPTPAQPEPGQDVVWTLAGQFTALAPLITPPPLFWFLQARGAIGSGGGPRMNRRFDR